MLVVNFLDADIPTPFAQTATVVTPQSEPLKEKSNSVQRTLQNPFVKGESQQ
jgi:hypothetical protein